MAIGSACQLRKLEEAMSNLGGTVATSKMPS